MTTLMVSAIVGAVALLAIASLIIRKKTGSRPVPAQLKPGQPLPEFSAVNEDGGEVRSADLRGNPAVILFVRGSWCPFCSRQVAELTKHYKDINELGAKLILVTPKPLETTHRVAKFYDVDFDFWLDERLKIANQLGLHHSKGVPSDFEGEYGEDTVWPASIVVDKDGIIHNTWLSKTLMDRPRPEKLIQAVRAL